MAKKLSSSVAKVKQLYRSSYNYWRYDFKEMAFPSSIPDPPGTIRRRKATWNDHVYVWKTACRIYLKTLKTNDVDVETEMFGTKKTEKQQEDKEKAKAEPSILEDLAVAARSGSEHIRPALQRIYMTKASAYRDALKSFVQGYQEGLMEVLKPSPPTKNDKAGS